MLKRNELYKLYEKPTKLRSVDVVDSTEKLTTVNLIIITLMMSLMLSIIVVMVNYFKQIINSNSVMGLLPIIATLLVAWSGLMYVVLSNISNKLYKIGADTFQFVAFYCLVALPISQTIFNVYLKINGTVK